jgi:hypothetical protein
MTYVDDGWHCAGRTLRDVTPRCVEQERGVDLPMI